MSAVILSFFVTLPHSLMATYSPGRCHVLDNSGWYDSKMHNTALDIFKLPDDLENNVTKEEVAILP